ncbi:DUF2690 domain-containing protein [Nonomuraea sp. SMC257]|uniref:DUF2690 domain-containing protein n=1 Tax=Nonomuraea montanisoli TaxID=2741721 RepID=A0A7Y6M1F8_9ACTN|nr:DUF2690 domain-containing protein [Nonomuraea montanisoli]NUW30079.1 DUF2690 domain-containing protein [Nonomuraea montanisoli]
MKLRAVVTAVGAVAAAVVVMSPAQAATAQARGYDHKDPYQTGCGNSARAVRTGNINSRLEGKIGTVKLMYSFSCKTNWIEINTITAGYGSITVQNARGTIDTFQFRKGNGGRHWGNMVNGNNMCAWGSASVKWGSGMGGQVGTGGTGQACK